MIGLDTKNIVFNSIRQIKSDFFKDLDMDMIVNEENELLNSTMADYDKYMKYYNERHKYNLNYSFKETIKGYQKFYDILEVKLKETYKINPEISHIDHRVNMRIVSETKKNAKKINSFFNIFNVFHFSTTVLLLFFLTGVSTFFKATNYSAYAVLITILFAILKVYLDKKVLEVYLEKYGWEIYKKSVRRSFAFFLASLIIIQKIEKSNDVIKSEDDVLDFKKKIRESIEIILEDLS